MRVNLSETHEARKQIAILRRECFLSYRDISTAADVSIRAIRNCEKYDILKAEARVRLDSLYEICRMLLEILERRYIREWLRESREPKEIFGNNSVRSGRCKKDISMLLQRYPSIGDLFFPFFRHKGI